MKKPIASPHFPNQRLDLGRIPKSHLPPSQFLSYRKLCLFHSRCSRILK